MRLAIIDSGGANIASVRYAIERLGVNAELTTDPERVRTATHVILPGVGMAADCMSRLQQLGLVDVIKQLKQPMLGICVGMQLLFEGSDEGDVRCLGLLPGRARRLDPAPGRPVPHMGWSRLTLRAEDVGLATGDYAYFAHSFACDDGPDSLATVDHGRPIAAAVRKGNLRGAQFHPERSGAAGARFLAAFLSC